MFETGKALLITAFLSKAGQSRFDSKRSGWLAVAVLFLLPAWSVAQVVDEGTDIGNGGRHRIEGTLYLPGGRRLEQVLTVRLGSIGFGEQYTTTDTNGRFYFYRLRSGTYTLTIDSRDFEPVNETVQLLEPMRRDTSETALTQMVQINLKMKATTAGAAPATVSAAAAGIPEPALKLYNGALTSVKAGDRAKAIDQLNQALALYPKFAAALNELGLQYLAQKKYPKAIESFKAALNIQADSPQAGLNLGIALVESASYRDAAVQLRDFVKKHNDSAQGRMYLGDALVRLGSYEDAEPELKESIRLGGDSVAEAHRFLAICYIQKGKGPEAAEELKTYLKLAPNAKDADKIRQLIRQFGS
ncbi:MAG TPA: tetratricopeptide repeat protein [Blastocatellia bacterium]|nr:tetratricopeptide repeat protein [Blastocatellia bacterium]